MALSPQRSRRLAFVFVALGFLCELAGVMMLSAERRTPVALGVMVVGLILVIAGVTMISAARDDWPSGRGSPAGSRVS